VVSAGAERDDIMSFSAQCAQRLSRAKETHTVLAPKLANMVRAQNFFKCIRRKPILQATVKVS
jgi:hypothetical protein